MEICLCLQCLFAVALASPWPQDLLMNHPYKKEGDEEEEEEKGKLDEKMNFN